MEKVITHKICTKCDTVKPVSEFWHHNKKSNDGYYFWCKSCQGAHRRKRYAESADVRKRISDDLKKFRTDHPDEYRARQLRAERKARKAHPDKFRAKAKRYYARNREKYKEYRRRYAEKPKAKVTAKTCTRCGSEKPTSEFRKNKNTRDGFQYWCKSCQNEYHRIRYATSDKFRDYHDNKENRRRARKVGNGGSHTVKEWLELCGSYDNVCLCCKKPAKLQRDHVVPLSLGGADDISNIQPLCRSCNSRKGARMIDYRVSNPITQG